mgnify:CR=1 FL=1
MQRIGWRFGRWTAVCLLALLLTSPAALAGKPRAEILWDTWGVPHIFARDEESLFHAFGWAQAASHGNLLLRLYGQARGRGAEYWGEQYLEVDRWVRLNGVPARAREWRQAQPPAFRRSLDAFAAGINAYAARHPDRLEEGVKVVLPVEAADVLAHTHRVIHFSFVAAPPGPQQLQRLWQPAPRAPARPTGGSNAWAVAPSRAAGGKAMLLANPHLPWTDYFLFYEAQLAAQGVDVHGTSLVGFPVPGIAFNDYLGWTHTVITLDGADYYLLTLSGDG